MKIHELKSWPEHFTLVRFRLKTFEIRVDDRGFKEGDILLLREWNPLTKIYTGKETLCRVTCTYGDSVPGIEPGYCVLGIVVLYDA